MYSHDQSPTFPSILMVEGNIGAGKSTFLNILKNGLKLDVIFEPTNKWQSKDEESNLLHLFYKDTPRWAYTFQSYAFISRVQAILEYQVSQKNTDPEQIKVLERSVYCDRFCFAKNCYESGLMTQLEWQIYKEWFSWLVEKYTPTPRGFIYLQTTPQTCYKRIHKRHRKEESAIPMSYLEALHTRHEDWLVHQKGLMTHLKTVPVLILDCNEEFETSIENQKKHLTAVQNFIDQQVLPILQPTGKTIQASP